MDVTTQDWTPVRRNMEDAQTISSNMMQRQNLKSSSKEAYNCKKCDCANSIRRRKKDEKMYWTLDSNNDKCSSSLCHQTNSNSNCYLKRLRQYFPVKSLLTFLLLVTLPQSVSSAPSSLSPVTSSELSNKKQQSATEKYLLMEEEMQATQASACNSLEPPFLKTEDKIVLAPIVFQGQLMAKSNVYNSMYFVSFRVHKVWKGRLPRRIHRHVRLLFHTEHQASARRRMLLQQQHQDNNNNNNSEDDDDAEQQPHELNKRNAPKFLNYRINHRDQEGNYFDDQEEDLLNWQLETSDNVDDLKNQSIGEREMVKRSTPSGSPTTCAPVRFNVQAGKKYLIYMKKIAHGRYVPVAIPDDDNKKTRKLAKKLSCSRCAVAPKVSELRPTLTVSEGANIKLKCKVSGSPTPDVTWLKNGHPLRPNFRFTVKTKKRRSLLRVSDVNRRDMGKYSCSAKNVLGEHSQTSSITVRYTVPDPPPSNCPIESFCLNEGKCFYYEVIGELVCKCTEGFAGQRCQFKKARINLPFVENEACGPYGHDIHLREICAAWKRPPVTEMSREEYDAWLRVEAQLAELRREKEIEQMKKFREMANNSNYTDSVTNPRLEAMALIQETETEEYDEYEQEENSQI